MFTRLTHLVLVSALIAVVPSVAVAQERWSVELIPGVAVPTADLGDAELSTGVGADATLGYRIMPHLSVYGGWGWRHFTSDLTFAGPDIDVEETGYLFGLRFEHPMGDDRAPALVIRLGGTSTHLELENTDGDIVGDSGHSLGFEAGVGVAFRLGDRWRVTPGVRFRSSDHEFDAGGAVVDAPLRYVTLDVAFSRRF